eukprot:3407323-Rhodomonas_salina.1
MGRGGQVGWRTASNCRSKHPSLTPLGVPDSCGKLCMLWKFFDNVQLKEYLGSGGSPSDTKYIKKIFAKEISP